VATTAFGKVKHKPPPPAVAYVPEPVQRVAKGAQQGPKGLQHDIEPLLDDRRRKADPQDSDAWYRAGRPAQAPVAALRAEVEGR
jgi:hypothetical protein